MKHLAAALLLSAFAATPALAQSAFDGTWKTDLSTLQMPSKPDVFALKGGVYTCDSCVPRIEIPADGKLHAVTGHAYFDHMSARALDGRAIQTSSALKGKLTFVGTSRVSADGKTLTFSFRDTSNANGKIVTGTGTETRVGPGPAGAHPVSGSWREEKMQSVSEAGLIVTYRTEGDMLHMSTPTGQSFDAKIGGPAVPVRGDNAGTMAMVKGTSATSLEETDMRDGKVVGVMTMTVEPGGGSAKFTWDDRIHGTTQSWVAKKQ